MGASLATVVSRLSRTEKSFTMHFFFYFISLVRNTFSCCLVAPITGSYRCTYVLLPITHTHSIIVPLHQTMHRITQKAPHALHACDQMQHPAFPCSLLNSTRQPTHPHPRTSVEIESLPEKVISHVIESFLVGDILSPRFPRAAT